MDKGMKETKDQYKTLITKTQTHSRESPSKNAVSRNENYLFLTNKLKKITDVSNCTSTNSEQAAPQKGKIKNSPGQKLERLELVKTPTISEINIDSLKENS